MKETFRVNNFDIIRLIAALQVVLHHSMVHLLGVGGNSTLYNLLSLLPGVPIFFFVSGFLISKSYENNSRLIEYAQNRILRIYPALIICILLAVGSVYLTGYFANTNISLSQLLIWILGQITVAQFYNPEFMRNFGCGVLNGSLWTITVELQFYIIVPIIYWLFNLTNPSKSKNNRKILLLILFFMMINVINTDLFAEHKNNLIYKLWSVTFIPWVYMFLIGILFQKNFEILHKFLSKKMIYLFPIYLIVSYFSVHYLHLNAGNRISPILYPLLASVVFSFAYFYPTLGKKLLKGNDISYGVYIYHMPIINLLIYYGLVASLNYVYLTTLTTILFATFSWLVIEKPSMSFKKHPLNPLNHYNKTIKL